MKGDIDFLDVGVCILMFFIGLCALIFVFSYTRDSNEIDCVKFYEEHNGYILRSCEKYSDKLNSMEEKHD